MKRELVYVFLVHLFDYFARFSFCPISLSLGVGGWLQFVVVALLGLFYEHFKDITTGGECNLILEKKLSLYCCNRSMHKCLGGMIKLFKIDEINCYQATVTINLNFYTKRKLWDEEDVNHAHFRISSISFNVQNFIKYFLKLKGTIVRYFSNSKLNLNILSKYADVHASNSNFHSFQNISVNKKTYLSYANNKGADQPARRCRDSIISILAQSKISRIL